MAKWIDIGPTDQFPTGTMRCVSTEDRQVIVCNADGKLAAVDPACPHAGKPMIDGELRGKVLTCAYHAYAYDVFSGRNTDFPYEELPLPTYPIRVTDAGRVEIQTTRK